MEAGQRLDRYFKTVFRLCARPIDFEISGAIDFSFAKAMIAKAREQGERITIGAIVCGAVAAALRRHPGIARQCGLDRDGHVKTLVIVRSAVLGTAITLPVLDADLERPAALTERLAEARRAADQGLLDPVPAIARWPRVLPITWLARLLWLSWTVCPRIRRALFGHPIITIMPDAEVLTGHTRAAPLTIAMGAVRERPCMRNGTVEGISAAWVSTGWSHDIANAAEAAAFFASLRSCVEHGLTAPSDARVGNRSRAAGAI